jgi:Domain of unknown function (DUF6484)
MTIRPVISSDDDSPVSGQRFVQPRLGTINRIEGQLIMVEFDGSRGPRIARAVATLGRRRLEDAAASAQPVLLVFERGDPDRPIIIGLLDQGTAADDEQERVVSLGLVQTPAAQPARVLQADVDGQRIRIVGKDEIVLECGQASITLRRNGKVVVRGTYIETYATGTNRVKGGQVRIN